MLWCEFFKTFKLSYLTKYWHYYTLQDERIVRSIFGENVQIKLDLKHFNDRLKKTLKSTSLNDNEKKLFRKQVTHLTRQTNDKGTKRTLETASSAEIVKNIEKMEDYWSTNEKGLPQVTKDAFRNAKKHAEKGCVANLRLGAQTQQNENLHMHFKDFLVKRYIEFFSFI